MELQVILVVYNLTFGGSFFQVEEDMMICEQHRDQMVLRMQTDATQSQAVMAECIYADVLKIKREEM